MDLEEEEEEEEEETVSCKHLHIRLSTVPNSMERSPC
jgi:hypothetical protein